jgi:hypothetical protein
MPAAPIRAAHGVWLVVQSEDGQAWNVLLAWDDGRRAHVLRFESREDAEAWIRDRRDGLETRLPRRPSAGA